MENEADNGHRKDESTKLTCSHIRFQFMANGTTFKLLFYLLAMNLNSFGILLKFSSMIFYRIAWAWIVYRRGQTTPALPSKPLTQRSKTTALKT